MKFKVTLYLYNNGRMAIIAVKFSTECPQYAFDFSTFPMYARYGALQKFKHILDVCQERHISQRETQTEPLSQEIMVVYECDRLPEYKLFAYQNFLAVARSDQKRRIITAFRDLSIDFSETTLLKVNHQRDAFQEIQQDLNEMTEIMTRNIDTLLRRGEKIEDLIERTKQLEMQSSRFRSSASDLNSRCCVIL